MAGSAILLSGCTLVAPYERPVTPLPAAYPATAAAPDAPTPAEVPWRRFFSDERLQRLIEIGLANNLDLRVAVLRVEQSRAQQQIVRSDAFVPLTGSGAYSRSRTSGRTADTWSASVGVTAYELDFFGRVRSLDQQALERFLATVEAQRSAQIALVAEIASQYFGLRQSEAQAGLAEQTLTAVRQSHEVTRAKFEAGASSQLDVRTAEAQIKTAEINLLTYRRQAAQANNALEQLLGQPLPAQLPAARPFVDGELLAPISANLPSELVQLRPDILQAEHTLKAAHANIGAARAAFFPSLSLTGALGTASPDLDQLLAAGTGTGSFVPQIKIPLFDGGRNRANLDAARVGARIEVANYQKAIQTAFREVADALVASDSYAREFDARIGLIDAQRARFDLANARFVQGEDTYLSVLSAQQDLYSAEQGRLLARYQLLASRLSLYRALGGGW